MKTKRDLSDIQLQQALELRNADWSLGKIARHFKTNKPSILKALMLWDSGLQHTPEGKAFLITKGKVTLLPDRDITKKDPEIEALLEESTQAMKKLKEKKNG